MTPKKEKEEKEINLFSKVVPASIEQEMKSSYIDYAMSVIVGRALPDVRDGLKPVHRRILYAMDELGLQPGKPYKKSARVVGEVLGKYHPHGDIAVYDSLVRMAQEFSLRYMLVDGQGNFGSVDGDSAAAMRYTETRLGKISTEMLADIEKETVNFGPNFDESLQEPLVLPSRVPNLLINGSSGIAVGMATNIPPHNLGEAVDAAVALIDDPKLEISDLMKIIKGPDFPTGAIICGRAGIKDAYLTGRGLLKVRARVEFEEHRGKEVIIVTEIPYLSNKAELVTEIAELVKDKKIVGISDLRDESDRKGMRVYIEIKKDVSKDVVLNQLYKRTRMEATYGVNLVALVNNEPKLLNLKDMLAEYLKHREEVVIRRTKFELKKAEEQAHILEGLLIAVSNIDKVVKLIRESKNPDEAREGLMQKFKLSKIQAQAILDLRLQRLTQLERHKIDEEYKGLLERIKELKKILADRKEVLRIIKRELLEVKDKYGDKRRTTISGEIEDVELEELIPEEEVAVLITRDGYVKRMPVSTFRAQLRGGRGVAGMATAEEDQIDSLCVASTHDFVLFFTNKGRVYKLKVYDLPQSSRAAKGQSIANVLQVTEGEVVTANVLVKSFDAKNFLMMATQNGLIKKVTLEDFANIRRSGIIAIKLKDKDELGWVKETQGKDELILGAQSGLMIRFKEGNVRPMGRAASGVRGIRLAKGDQVVSMDIVTPKGDLLVISESGFGKRMKIGEFGVQNRGGKGHIAIKLRDKDKVAGMKIINPDDELLFVTKNGTMSRQTAAGISTQGRYAKGVRIQRLDPGDEVADVARVVTKEQEEAVIAEGAKKDEK
ncbi:DNA gyrase subunit A [candidate division WOR-1 bacterium RIFOXYA12_FULL_43_27]|uniref:DNA gyrase subunit A n=1 Tax=candidate division WOR-1 bacterium RIFOXYC2_FULL_46_14 TaxID=1802587 RepID=A0A1F4U4X7_UNCSA|nr:MAG: DNA gyrase subunit A [candidate division WOR-1 bacterium RIFOXYA12_FULL_43_27]OGC20798.1 MAG: DNA gyrase subunit A [candidate division WOR-1 bacterium RIFOXYB2_FULL_46_45]OGC31465.1 MAG: DNA gyrase subunit A [candidate division WOR-1 bacterium RIFOXYA2_FULL_46_56]OGC39870.1 MAG: DNA gyrase subunit A [candidate division WOR-1 bacterium RIFOXYC2_FULL_46_14]